MTYQMPDLEMTKEEEIENLARILNSIKPLLEKYETMENNGYQNGTEIMSKDDFSNLWYYKYKDLYFYHELLKLFDGDKEKLETVVKNWKPSGGVILH